MKFRQICINYGLSWQEFKIFNFNSGNYLILLIVPNKEIYILLDKNYNTICIEKCDWISDFEDLNKKIEEIYQTMHVNNINLRIWIEENTLKKKIPVLKISKTPKMI